MADDLSEILKNTIQEAVVSTSLINVEWLGERHGSWEWIAHSEKGTQFEDLNRFITLALTGPAPMYEVEIWAGADNKERFARHLVAGFVVTEKSLTTPEILKDIRWHLKEAAKRAESLQLRDLAESYLPPYETI